MSRYSWVTNEMFDNKLEEIVADEGGIRVLHIPGVYEIVKEHFNNEVLEALESDREGFEEDSDA